MEFDAGVFGGELPFDFGFAGIAFGFPCGNIEGAFGRRDKRTIPVPGLLVNIIAVLVERESPMIQIAQETKSA